MKKGKTYTLDLRRKREGKTHYKKRLKLLMSDKHRLVVRRSIGNIQANIVAYDAKGDKIVLSAHSAELKKFGWKLNKGNLPSAYLVGVLLGKKAKSLGIKSAVLDLGLNKSVKGSRFYAVVAGALDADLEVPHNPGILPNKDRIAGEHIAKYAAKLKDDEAALKKQFGSYLKNNIDPKKIVEYFNEIKSKVK